MNAPVCLFCGAPFLASRSDAVTCSPGCKKALQRLVKKRWPGTESTLRTFIGFHHRDVQQWKKDVVERGFVLRPRSLAVGRRDGGIEARFPHGATVLYQASSRVRLPGLVNWHSSLGDEIRASGIQTHVPIDTMCGLVKVPALKVQL